uniref:Reverse transcriptase domain-containing protein n=1 Tax=Tanacetum cinerariifolium TaxID=118510 RepID=A0A6L2NIC5_TANCI|nr:reverse transcriptase domain-containing protein [Tanacetum cinerariifolium]
MSTQQYIYADVSKNPPPMLNKDNYVPWPSRLLCYAKSKPNEKLIYNSIMNGSYVRRMIPEPNDPDREVPVAKTFHEHNDDELTKKEVKQMEDDDQAIKIILMCLPEDIYAAIDSCKTAQEIWLRIQQMMKGSDIGIQDKKANTVCQEQVVHNAVQNPGIQNVRNQNGHIVVLWIANQNLNLIGNAEEFDFMAAARDLDEIEEVNANCILMAHLQQALTSGTQIDKAPVYDSDGSAEVHEYDNCYNNEIFNMFTQEEQYTDLLKPIPEPHQVQQNNSDVISATSSVEQSEGTLEQNPATVEETRGDLPVPDHRTMEELCQPTLNGRGGPIALIAIQATNFGLKNDMIQQLQNSCQFHGLPGDDANKHFDKFLHVTQNTKNSITTFEQMAKMFLEKYFPPSMVTKLRNEITNFRQRPDESLFEAWERYKISIDHCPNHNMLPVTQIDTFNSGLTLRHRDTINAAAGGTFMKRHPEECYDLIKI